MGYPVTLSVFPSIAIGSDGNGGGVAAIQASFLILSNCTLTQNRSDEDGGGLFTEGGFGLPPSTVQIFNSILWENSDGGGSGSDAQIHVEAGSSTLVLHSCVQGGWDDANASGIVSSDPLFVDAVVNDFRLGAFSPCIDAGAELLLASVSDFGDLDDDGDTTEPVPVDLDGNPRVVDDAGVSDVAGGRLDIGAYERQEDSVSQTLES